LTQSSIYIDTSSEQNFKQVQSETFTPLRKKKVYLGYTSDTVWIHFSIKNRSEKTVERHLTLSNPMLDTVILYMQEGESYTKTVKGVIHLDQYDRNHILHPSFAVRFTPHERKSFYLKVHTRSCANYFSLILEDTTTLYHHEFTYQLIETLFFGAMLGLILYNLFLFFFVREPVYLYYVLYMFFMVLNHASYTLMLDYLIGEEYIHFETFFAIYYIGLTNIFILLFIRSFLHIKAESHLLFIKLAILTSLLLMLFNAPIAYMTNFSLVILFYTLYLCIDAYLKKNSQAKYILAGWSINLIGIFMLAFKEEGLWTIIDYIPYFFEMTLLAEGILFSAALASRLNKTKALERSLRTNTLLIKELHHRIKNNIQFILLIYRFKLENIMTPQLEQKLKEAEGSLQAISKIYEILYQQEDLEQLDTKAYFSALIDELKRSFDMSGITVYLDSTVQLNMHQSIYCGIILNELATNTFKYAFADKEGEIHISFKKEGNKTFFLFRDNGTGFDTTLQKHSSFGLFFIEALAKNELHGSFEIDASDGVRVQITF
jgi:two-component sensor histidine kinase